MVFRELVCIYYAKSSDIIMYLALQNVWHNVAVVDLFLAVSQHCQVRMHLLILGFHLELLPLLPYPKSAI